MNAIKKSRDEDKWSSEFLFFCTPWAGLLGLVLSKREKKAKKVVALLATLVGLVASAIVTY